MDFRAFPKIPRWSREIIITEKLDGTNASICITEDGKFLTGSRTRWITPENDNFGFSAWAHANKEELLKLGVGRHFGEWYGKGIQRGYGLPDRRFALFNTSRWENNPDTPECCEVVSVIYQGGLDDISVRACVEALDALGSLHVPGYPDPEGIVIFHTAANQCFKKLIKNDEAPKGIQHGP